MNEKEKSPPERARMNEEARLEAMRQCVLGMLDMAQVKAEMARKPKWNQVLEDKLVDFGLVFLSTLAAVLTAHVLMGACP